MDALPIFEFIFNICLPPGSLASTVPPPAGKPGGRIERSPLTAFGRSSFDGSPHMPESPATKRPTQERPNECME
ncbi:hypothetical protein F5B19DRAFT_491921 [Rostrohypoxylon terebratum]|nr:hypothetical protein F5B19DRAFT_491921 [Rostrohypoxylon terebratum]